MQTFSLSGDLPQNSSQDSIDAEFEMGSEQAEVLIIACGALAREILDIIRINKLEHIALTCVPAKLHNRPEQIPAAVQKKITANKGRYRKIYAGFADCGCGVALDKVLAASGVERLSGPHCYAFYAGQDAFAGLAENELGTFYLTDYLARHFDSLIRKGLQLDNEVVRTEMFRHYKRLVYLSQVDSAELDSLARSAATYLGLEYLRVFTGYGELQSFITSMD